MGPGYFGKFPSHGDFITKRLPREGFLDIWDRWLQGALAASREALGEAWLSSYLTSPLWRFALSAGICGPAPWAGILMPSVDSVGRYFPLTLAGPLAVTTSPLDAARELDEWYAALEETALTALDDPFDLQEFERRILDRPIPKQAKPPGTERPSRLASHGAAIYVELTAEQNPCHSYPNLLEQLLRDTYGHYSLWWTNGSDQITPCLLAYKGLPPPRSFSALLSGDWCGTGWRFAGDDVAAPPASPSGSD